MTSNARIDGLDPADQTTGGEIAVVQDVAGTKTTKKFTIGTAAAKNAGSQAGNVPILNSSGAVSRAQGGTGLTTTSPGANKELATDAAGTVGWYNRGSGGGGGGSVDFATETEVIEGTATGKAISPATLHDWRLNVEQEIGEGYTDWASETEYTAATLTDGGSLNSILIYNSSTRNAETAAIPVGGLRIFGPSCADLPTPSGSATFAWGLAFLDQAGVRWMLVSNTDNSREFFRLVSGSWQSEGTTGAELYHSYYGVPNDNRYRPVSSIATDNPRSPGQPFIMKRNGTLIEALLVAYSSSQHRLATTSRSAQIALTPGQVGTAELAAGAVNDSKIASNGNIALSKLAVSGTQASGKIIKATGAATASWQDDGGGSSFAVGGTKAAGKFVKATGTGADDQQWDDLAASDVPTLPLSKLNVSGTQAAGKIIKATSATAASWSDDQQGSGGLTTVNYSDIAAGAIATEKDIFDDPSTNSKLVPNKVLADALDERDNQLGAFWSQWLAQPDWTLSAIGNAGISVQGLGAGVVMVNTSSFNVRTSSIAAGNLYLCGTDCAGEPSLSSGTLRGGFLYIDTEGVRWYYPIDNPESPDSEDYFRLDGNSWVAEDYKGDNLRVHLHGLINDSKWNSFAAHSIGGPGSAINVFNGETAIARRVGNTIILVRGTYSTSTNTFTVSIANQVFTIPLTDGQVSTSKLADDAVSTSKLKTTNDGSNGQMLVKAGESLTYQNVPSGGGGVSLPTTGKADGKVLKATGTGASDNAWEDDTTQPGTGEINGIAQFASAMLADEEDVLDAGSSNTALVGNATLKGIIEDISSDHIWGNWTAATTTAQLSFPNSGNGGFWTIPNLGGDGQMAVVNASQFNAQTVNIGAGRPNFFGPLCSGLPTLSSGTIRGALVILDDEGKRWAIPVSNPEGPDSEATFELVSGSWVARGYRADDLRLDFARIRSDSSRYEVFSSLALHGPTDNALRDEVLLARSDGRSQYALRVAFNTNLVQYEIVTAKRDAVFNLRADEVQASNIDTTNAGSDGQILVKAGEQFTYEDKPSSPSLSLTEEEIYSSASGINPSSSNVSLSSGKSFANYNEIYLDFHANTSGLRQTSALMPVQRTTTNSHVLVGRQTTGNYLYFQWKNSNTQFAFSANGLVFETAAKLYKIIGRKYTLS